MTNIFRILWFEDNSSWYNMELRKVKRHLMETYCLELGSVRNIGTDFDFERLKTDNNYDLILMDYVLAAGNTGKRKIPQRLRNLLRAMFSALRPACTA